MWVFMGDVKKSMMGGAASSDKKRNTAGSDQKKHAGSDLIPYGPPEFDVFVVS